MTRPLADLYGEVILDHHRRPRNFRAIPAAAHAEGSNPICGDRVTVYVRVEDDVIAEAAFQGYGCAITTASASLMTQAITGGTVAAATELFEHVAALIAAQPEAPAPDLGELTALSGVRRFPARATCALLPWQALAAALSMAPPATRV